MMLGRLSLRYRIALVIFVLEACMLAGVLGVALTQSQQTASDFDRASQQASLELLSNLSVTALLTGEYSDYQLYIQDVEKQPSVERIVLADLTGLVVASSRVTDVGHRFAEVVPTAEAGWQIKPVQSAAGALGTLAVAFSDAALVAAHARIRNLALVMAMTGMTIIALVGLATGIALTRRLERVTDAARRFADGDRSVRSAVGGADEVALLSDNFDRMADAVAQQQQRLRQQSESIELLLNSTTEAIYGGDREGRFTFVNRACVQILGYAQASELIGKDIHATIHHSHVDGRAYPSDDCPIRLASRRKLSAHVDDEVHWRADGTSFPVEYWSHPMTRDGKVVGTVVTFIDTTERRRAELALKHANEALEQRVAERTAELQRLSRRNELILGVAIDGFFSTDAQGRIRDANPAFCTMLGYTRDELLRLAIPDIEANESVHEVAAHIEKVHRQGFDRFETSHRRKDGGTVDVEISVNLVDLAGEPLLFAFARDITERKRAEQLLRAAKTEAERANLAKSEFLSRMSHELRTPLNAILGFGQLLELDAQGKQHRHVQEILRAGHHLLELINEVLDLARVESGALAISLEPVALRPVAEECMALLRPQAEARGVHLLDRGTGCDVHVRADRTRLKQVLLNLLSNAVKYNRPQGTVSLDCAPEAGTGAGVRVSVKDTGPGLTAGQQSRLFVPFERLDADNQRIEGTGIGLALSKRLVELMGGRIGVESTPGQGSSFWIALPLAEGVAARGPEQAADAAHTQTAVPGEPTRLSVLCIEDNPANLRLVESIFAGRRDLRLLTAIAPGQGLEMARAHRPALILLDINLPDLDGYAVLQRLREHAATCAIPVVAISANAMPDDLERGKAAGFAEYLTKPLDVQRLLEVMDRLCSAPVDDE